MEQIAIIGGVAAEFRGWARRQPSDVDIICTHKTLQTLTKDKSNITAIYPTSKGRKTVVKTQDDIVEAEIAWSESHTERLFDYIKKDPETMVKTYNLAGLGWTHALIPSNSVLLMLKESHKYLRNSPHFEKTHDDIKQLRLIVCGFSDVLKELLREREAETYDYNHPKLNVSKEDFFNGDGVQYIYDHDSIHVSIADALGHQRPTYTKFQVDEVKCSKELFFNMSNESRLSAVMEETYVLALERSLIPFPGKMQPRDAFKLALQKVCTSITSGWFREYAWNNYRKALESYDGGVFTNFWIDVSHGYVNLAKD